MMTEDDFMAVQEDICERYAADSLTLDEAIAALKRLGFWEHEARDLLQECVL
jgi:Holliday junction resolvasome RuvABC DNA-binding subunit